jgi:hypothetical protein
MSRGNPPNLKPPIAPQEIKPVEFDFAPWIETSYDNSLFVASVEAVNITVSEESSADDPDPQSRLQGMPAIVPSTSQPSITAGAIAAWVGTMLPNVTYVLQGIANMSDGRSKPSIEVTLLCYDPES